MTASSSGIARGSPWQRSSVFLRAFARALREPATYDVRNNPGLWLGLVLAAPLPILVALFGGARWVLVVSLAAPVFWSIVVGASARVGIAGATVIRQMTVRALDRERVHEERYGSLRGAVDDERREHKRLAGLRRAADQELALGQIVQRSLVPAAIERADLDVAVRHVPCTHVGGDYLRASLARPELLYLCVGDVAGHGVAAALVVSRIHSLVEGMIMSGTAPGPFLDSLDSATLHLFEGTSLFMTFAVLRVELSRQRIDYATAGHPPPWLLRAGRDLEELATPGLPLGVQRDATRHRQCGSTTYASGDVLLLFTDGLFEMRAPGGGIWGQERLRSLFVSHSRSTSDVAATRILRQADDHRGARTADDDVSLIVARLGALPLPAVPVGGRRAGFVRV